MVVYKANDYDDTIEKLSSINVVKECQDNNINFSKGLLYKSENNILLLDKNDPNVIYQYDLPKEKIVNIWETDGTEILDICSKRKEGQRTNEPLIYGVNSDSVFTLDERVGNKNHIVNIKSYFSRNDTNIIMSNYNGQFVTGSIRGELRLYDKMGFKAKNTFSFYEDPIRFIDISSDDQNILLTCDKYILLVSVEKNPFLRTLKGSERKTPIRLGIKIAASVGLFVIHILPLAHYLS